MMRLPRSSYILISCVAVVTTLAVAWDYLAGHKLNEDTDTHVQVAPETSGAPTAAALRQITSNRPERNDSAQVTTHTPAVKVEEPFVVSAMIEDGYSMDAAIRHAITLYGVQDPRVGSIAVFAMNACAVRPDPHDATDPDNPDPSRVWAIKRFLDLCKGFDIRAYNLQPIEQPSAVVALSNGEKERATQIAWERLATANDLRSLDLAGKVLLANRQFPLGKVLGPLEKQFGRQDLDYMWRQAAQLVTCEEMGYCGTQSLFVASYCAREGCLPGSTLIEAWRQNMSPVEYQAVVALYEWLAKFRRMRN